MNKIELYTIDDNLFSKCRRLLSQKTHKAEDLKLCHIIHDDLDKALNLTTLSLAENRNAMTENIRDTEADEYDNKLCEYGYDIVSFMIKIKQKLLLIECKELKNKQE